MFCLPVFLIDEVEALIALILPAHAADQEKPLCTIIETAKIRIKWLAGLSCLEVREGYKPNNQMDQKSDGSNACFYHMFVPCLKRYYLYHQVLAGFELFTVFILHSGVDKNIGKVSWPEQGHSISQLMKPLMGHKS
jgi:hypothetical protein